MFKYFTDIFFFSDTDAEHEKGIQPLRETLDFSRFLVISILQKLTQVCENINSVNLIFLTEHTILQREELQSIDLSLYNAFLFQIHETKLCDGPGGKNPEHIVKQCCSLGRQVLL